MSLRKAFSVGKMTEHRRTTALADFILGSQDGMVNVLGIVLGVAIASQDLRLVYVSGLAATFAESISMAAVAYTSALARRDQYLALLEMERLSLEKKPEEEQQEVRDILQEWGFEGEDLENIHRRVIKNRKAMLDIMMSYEFNLAPIQKYHGKNSALRVGLSTLAGSLIPLVPFFILQNVLWGVVASILFTALILYYIGWYKAKLTIGEPYRSGIQMIVIGISAAFVGFIIGLLLTIIG